MGLSARRTLLSVYGSNRIVKYAFHPLCYFIFFSPFVLLVLRYKKIDQQLLQKIPTDWKTPEVLPQVWISVFAVLLATRLLSGWNAGNDDSGNHGERRVQLIPYWVPVVRHWWQFLLDGRFLNKARDSSINLAFSFGLAGGKHNIVLSPSFLDQIAKNKDAVSESDIDTNVVLQNAFGMPRSAKQKYLELRPSISKAISKEIMQDTARDQIMKAVLKALGQSLPDLITFNSSMVDQMPWERVAGLDLTEGTVEAEAELFNLINEFFCNIIMPPLTGAQFPESYQLLASDLATFNSSRYLLALGFPRWFPMPGLPGASLSKMRLLNNLTTFFYNLENPPIKKKRANEDSGSESESEEETDAEAPTPFTAFNDLFKEHNLPIRARASIALEVLSQTVGEVVLLAFWTLSQIYSSSQRASSSVEGKDKVITPVERVLEETKTWARTTQPPSIHPLFPAPPEITFSSLVPLSDPSKFPYLRSCINEARRLYSTPVSASITKKPLILIEDATGIPQKWKLDSGSYIDIGLSQTLINTSPANYIDATTYKHDRFVNSTAPLPAQFDSASEPLATSLLIAFVAGMVQLWDIQAPPKKTFFDKMEEAQGKQVERKNKEPGVWRIPKGIDSGIVKSPRGEVRVRIRRREGLPTPLLGVKKA